MDTEPDADASSRNLSAKLHGDDSEEDTSYEEAPATSWSELSIIERVGLNSVEMSEKDLETAFSQITLAFRCDQYTLKQRLQAEEHARNLAEENIQLELTRGRETLETLKGLCLDSKRSNILQRLELCLDILGGTVERISNTAEVLGAVHQEARVSRAVELMVAHVESLRRRHDRNVAELQDIKQTVQQQQQKNVYRSNINPTITPDAEGSDGNRTNSHHSILRRRISASIINTSQTQNKRKRDLRKQVSFNRKPSSLCLSRSLSAESNISVLATEDSLCMDGRPHCSEAPAAQPPPHSSPIPKPECPPSEQAAPVKTQNKTLSLETLGQRHKGKAALSNRGKERKAANIHRQNSIGTYGTPCRQHPLAPRLFRCRWTLICTNLFVLLFLIMLTCLLW
ncbi:uncharacterized protein PAE49_010970 [Odontesthes bonariensis]|uniref:uncharacterized protein LOC142390128 n=1 Tax=Odontesthes bonariensis TaxID=219752 RepID=UPI003F584B74